MFNQIFKFWFSIFYYVTSRKEMNNKSWFWFFRVKIFVLKSLLGINLPIHTVFLVEPEADDSIMEDQSEEHMEESAKLAKTPKKKKRGSDKLVAPALKKIKKGV